MAVVARPNAPGKTGRRTASMLTAALESMPYGFSIWDSNDRLVLFNRRYAELYHFNVDALYAGMPLAEICELTLSLGNHRGVALDELLALYTDRLARARREPASLAIEKDIRGRHVKSTYHCRPGLGVVVTHEDVTEQRSREAALSGKHLGEVVESIGVGICLWSNDLALVAWNSAYERLQVQPGYRLQIGARLSEVLDNVYPLKGDARSGAELEALVRERLAADGRFEADRVTENGRTISVAYHPFSGGGWIALYQDVTERREAMRRLQASEAVLKAQNAALDASLDSMSYGFCLWNCDLKLELWNERYLQIYALAEGSVHKGHSLSEVFLGAIEAGHFEGKTARELSEFYGRQLNGLDVGAALVTEETLGNGRVIKITYRRAPDMSFVATHEDVTEERDRVNALRQRESELRLQNMRFSAAVDNMSQGLCMFDREGRLVICNKRYADLYGIPPELVQPGTSLRQILEHRISRGLTPLVGASRYMEDRFDAIRARQERVDEIEFNDGRIIRVLHHPMRDGGWVATHQDVTTERRNEDRIRHLARHDALTELPNRMYFRERMAAAESEIRRGRSIAVLCIDLDHFKAVNDSLGHSGGDAVLREVAERLRIHARRNDIVARLGGDEFAVLCGPIASPDDAASIADRIVKAMAEPFKIGGHSVLIGASIGIAVAPSDGDATDTLIKNADLALYRAKAEGRGAYHFFERGMDAALQERLAIEVGLRSALTNGEISLVYQPLFDLSENRIRGFEALLRWRHPEFGTIMPNVIVPVAEESGLIVPIGEWVLREACRTAATWPDNIRVAVNLSPVQFKNRSLVQFTKVALKESGLAPERLELEITETALFADNDSTLATLHELRALGIRISMDDFGTGYSALSYLRAFPFDKIKIDQSFVRDISSRQGANAIIKAVISLGQSLGMSTTAEGIETEAQLELVREQGCTEVQGYLFSRPLPAADVARLLMPQEQPGRRAKAS